MLDVYFERRKISVFVLSFDSRGEGHFDCGPKNHGVSIELAREAFTRINNLSNKYIKDLVRASVDGYLRYCLNIYTACIS